MSKSKPSSWHLATLAAIVVIISAVGIVFYLNFSKTKVQNTEQIILETIPTPSKIPTKTNISTKNWKVYTNNNFRYSFKYPPDWIFPQQEVYGSVPYGNRVLISPPTTNGKFDQFNISVYILDETPEIVEYWKNNLMNPKKTLVDGFEGRTGNLYSASSISTVINHNSKIWDISASPENSDKIDTYFQILSTFKFLD